MSQTFYSDSFSFYTQDYIVIRDDLHVKLVDPVKAKKIETYKKSQNMRDNHKHENINMDQVELHHKKETAQAEWFNKFFNK